VSQKKHLTKGGKVEDRGGRRKGRREKREEGGMRGGGEWRGEGGGEEGEFGLRQWVTIEEEKTRNLPDGNPK
jgi:hypothetical protein